MATLNLSTNGPSISKSYQSVVDSSPSSDSAAAKSATYAQWVIYSVSAPLINAFQQDFGGESGGKESVLKVQNTGDGELVDLIDEFSDGRVQFAFVKVKDPNTSLPKNVLICWCGEGVPERTKGYFTSHVAAVSKVLQGYHVQITARSDRDLTPEAIVQKVSDASGSKYSASSIVSTNAGGPSPPLTSKPAFTPTRSSGRAASVTFNPLTGSNSRPGTRNNHPVDENGWGQDAPQVTRTQLEKVQSAYKPTKVNMHELSSQSQEPSRLVGRLADELPERSDVVKGGYQPIGKVDIAALRRHAENSSSASDDRPGVVKGSYEPVGKVDIAAIRAKAQGTARDSSSLPTRMTPSANGNSLDNGGESKLETDRSAPFNNYERLTSLPKPRVANRFDSGTGSFTGTKAPVPGGLAFESKKSPTAPAVGASRTFADEGGKTPAQLWAEKKARERGTSGANIQPRSGGSEGPASPVKSQTSGGGEWKSGYSGKSWSPVQTAKTGQSVGSLDNPEIDHAEKQHQEAPRLPADGVGTIRDRFKENPPSGAGAANDERSAPSPPPLDTSTKPNAGRGVPIPGLAARPEVPLADETQRTNMPVPPPQPHRSPTPPTPAEDSGSPIRIAMPVSRNTVTEVGNAHEEQFSPPPSMPARSLAQAIPQDDPTDEPMFHDPARGIGAAVAANTFGQEAAEAAHPDANGSRKRALVQYDYEKAEDNEIKLHEGEYVTNIEMVDEDWWMGQNQEGETGLFPSSYVELVDDDGHGGHEETPASATEPESHLLPVETHISGRMAIALYDYEAAEDNELTFPEGARIIRVEFPDEDWWSGEYESRTGLFPANYVQLKE